MALGLILGGGGAASAQSPGGGNQNSPDGQRPQSTRIGFFELLESGGEAFMSLFQKEDDEPTVDDPDWNGYRSPRATVLTFLEAMNHEVQGREGALDRALEALPAGADRETAEHLLHVFDRLPEISPGSLPGKDRVEATKIGRYEVFPRGIESDFAYKALSDPPKGRIVLEAGEDGSWRFTQETADGAKELAESMKGLPPRQRMKRKGDLFLNTVGPTFARTPATGWLKAVLWLAAGLGLVWLFLKGVSRSAEKLASRLAP